MDHSDQPRSDESSATSHTEPSPSSSEPRTITFDRGDEAELAKALLDSLGPETIYDEGAFHVYEPDDGTWRRWPDESLEHLLSGFAGCPVLLPRTTVLSLTHNKISGAIKIARSHLLASRNRPSFAEAAPGVAFRNGFVWVCSGMVMLDPHHPVHLAQHASELEYISGAPHPMLDTFFAEVFADADPVDRNDQIALCQEFVGTCLIGEATKHQRCLVTYGPGANGKSQFLEIVESVFPPKAVASVPPQDWGTTFRLAGLVGVTVNLVNEIPEHEIVANAIFKSVITGEPLQGEQKFKAPFRFRSRAGHVFAANSLPGTNDPTNGCWRRFLVVPFMRDMTRAPSHQLAIAQRIISAERAAIVSWALEGAARVQRQGGYTVPASSERLLAQWRRESDSVRYFLETVCSRQGTTKASRLFESYTRWATSNGFRKVTSIDFGRRANQAGFASRHTNVGNLYDVTTLGFA